MENADGRHENPNDLFFKNPDFGHPSHRGPVLRDLCVYMMMMSTTYSLDVERYTDEDKLKHRVL